MAPRLGSERPIGSAVPRTCRRRLGVAPRTLRRRVLRFVETEFAAARQFELRQQAEALVAHRTAEPHALALQLGRRGVYVIAHQVELVAGLAARGWAASSAGGRAKISHPSPASTERKPSTSRKKARSASASVE